MKTAQPIAVVHSLVPQGAGPDDQDTLAQAAFISELLRGMGHAPVPVPVGEDIVLDLRGLAEKTGARLALNLVETVSGSCRGAWRVPVLLRGQGMSCTGSDGPALLCSTNKLLAGQVLARAGLPAPRVLDAAMLCAGLRRRGRLEGDWIVKSVWEHASLGLDADSVLRRPRAAEVLEVLALRRAAFGGDWYVETYVEGREFCLSLLDFDGGVQVLPPAEMRFENWDATAPRILGYAAKWHEDDPAWKNTNRSFRFSEQDAPLLDELARIALACKDAFGLAGYGRVDFRVDDSGRAWVIDVNANPCLAPDAGFAAALEQAGISPVQGLKRILDAGRRRGPAPQAEGRS